MRISKPALFGWLVLICGLAALAQEKETPKPERSPAEQKSLARIRQLGGLALELAQNDPRLDISYQQVDGKLSDEHFQLLKDLKDVVSLNFRGKDVVDAQLVYLAGLTSLLRLHLERTKITDQGLAHLKGLTNLEYLNLYGTDVSDAGLVNLEGMKKLKHLYLWQTKVTDAGVDHLKKALPQVEIVRGLDLPKIEEKKDAAMPKEKAKGKGKNKKKDDKAKDKDEKAAPAGKDKAKDKDDKAAPAGKDKAKDKDEKAQK